jgi:hypothetical protein
MDIGKKGAIKAGQGREQAMLTNKKLILLFFYWKGRAGCCRQQLRRSV